MSDRLKLTLFILGALLLPVASIGLAKYLDPPPFPRAFKAGRAWPEDGASSVGIHNRPSFALPPGTVVYDTAKYSGKMTSDATDYWTLGEATRCLNDDHGPYMYSGAYHCITFADAGQLPTLISSVEETLRGDYYTLRTLHSQHRSYLRTDCTIAVLIRSNVRQLMNGQSGSDSVTIGILGIAYPPNASELERAGAQPL
jgi:hypothetical protein